MPEQYSSIEDIQGLPPELLERIPEQGLMIHSFSRYDLDGLVYLDIDSGRFEYDSYIPRDDVRKKGTLVLKDGLLGQFRLLFEAIWSSESDFTGFLPARVMSTDLVLAQAGQYKRWNLRGEFAGEVNELHLLVQDLIRNSA